MNYPGCPYTGILNLSCFIKQFHTVPYFCLFSKAYYMKRKCWHLNGKASRLRKFQRNSANILSQWPRQLGTDCWAAVGGGKIWASQWHESLIKGLVLCHANSPAFPSLQRGQAPALREGWASQRKEKLNLPWSVCKWSLFKNWWVCWIGMPLLHTSDALFSVSYRLFNITWFFYLCSLEHRKLTYLPAQLLSHV